ncbi:hypothetical protein T484DRAFT_1907719 [Baffinella frigidus]|nr:hypothetical protein T484DRAFT_1907719 [Cryptophyta sp. CCMP2293]
MRASSSLAIAGILAVLPLHLHASSSLPGDRSSAQRASNSLGFATPTVMSPTRMQRSSTSPVRATYMGLSPRKLNLQIKSAFKRRHLGPTSDEIMEIRSKDAERKLVELRSTTSGTAEGDVQDSHLPWIDSAADSSNGRHLGPTLEEITVIRSSRKVLDREPKAAAVPEEPSWAAVAPSVEDKPSEEQLRALISLDVSVAPTSKEHAMRLIREAREIQLAEGLGFSTTNRRMGRLVPVDGTAERANSADADQIIANYSDSETAESSHHNMALKGINVICRRPQ